MAINDVLEYLSLVICWWASEFIVVLEAARVYCGFTNLNDSEDSGLVVRSPPAVSNLVSLDISPPEPSNIRTTIVCELMLCVLYKKRGSECYVFIKS